MRHLAYVISDQRRAAFSYAMARQKQDEGDLEVAALWQRHASAWAETARDAMLAAPSRKRVLAE